MEQGAIEILRKHGCLYMKDDYKALFEELEAYYKPTEVVKNNAVLPLVSFSLICVDTKHYTNLTIGKKYNQFKHPNCEYNSRRFIYIINDKGEPKAYYKTCFKQIYES